MSTDRNFSQVFWSLWASITFHIEETRNVEFNRVISSKDSCKSYYNSKSIWQILFRIYKAQELGGFLWRQKENEAMATQTVH